MGVNGRLPDIRHFMKRYGRYLWFFLLGRKSRKYRRASFNSTRPLRDIEQNYRHLAEPFTFGSELEISRCAFTYRTGGQPAGVARLFFLSRDKTSFRAKKGDCARLGLANQGAIKIHEPREHFVTLTKTYTKSTNITNRSKNIRDTCRYRLRDLEISYSHTANKSRPRGRKKWTKRTNLQLYCNIPFRIKFHKIFLGSDSG